MENQYYIREPTKQETDKLNRELLQVWEASNAYWYPLEESNRQDVIAFDANAFESIFGFEKLREILKESKEIYEIKEWKDKGNIVVFDSFEPQYDGDGEGFWFTKDMDWIIYCSHENSITFGGEALIQIIKEHWKDCNNYLY
ncbi:hypothetical protein H1230_17715 [Paenibacillus sp. 19GGS1-52]|uniref:hypothetical protein n=1 Tax=Paenibacillus sp. 19GGS1-52 TaxID=2758563 RepID=UPI001EFB22EB|nr:hypothetical protein [Paenibacillus sp. 19GGS1-52]ULO04968.1 hypothetical protein H1230_17715 [Paenibacillus sp. 19GGS1-52]